MALGLFLGLTADKPIEEKHQPVFMFVGLWCMAFDVLALVALFTV